MGWFYWSRTHASSRYWQGFNRTNYNWIISVNRYFKYGCRESFGKKSKTRTLCVVMDQVLNFFPLTILKKKINLTKETKTKMIEAIFAMEKKSKNMDYKNQSSAWTGDTQGFEYIHNDQI